MDLTTFQWIEAVGIIFGILFAIVRLIFSIGGYKTKIDTLSTDMTEIKTDMKSLSKLMLISLAERKK
ncbi:MAG: hypothetical protein K2Q34_05715 [Alphaproteobacteria bacterium]|nr:hypothetical protein [Alphaproteobacteria bacterium]